MGEGRIRMAKVCLTCMEESVARGLGASSRSKNIGSSGCRLITHIDDFLDADIVFTGDDARQYVPLLRDVRQKRPALPFIVVTKFPDTSKWLDALEAGASDYCSAPFESRQIHWLMESVLPRVWGASIDVGHSVKRAGV